MAKVYVFFITGFEEVEALTAVDVLRRGGVETVMVSLTAAKTVVGKNGVSVVTDILLDAVDTASATMLLLPGGTTDINEHSQLRDLVKDYVTQGGKVAAICAAPIVLGTLGLLKDKAATCYPSLEDNLLGAKLSTAGVVVDGNIVTGKGPAFSMEFALTVLEQIAGKETRARIAADLLFTK